MLVRRITALPCSLQEVLWRGRGVSGGVRVPASPSLRQARPLKALGHPSLGHLNSCARRSAKTSHNFDLHTFRRKYVTCLHVHDYLFLRQAPLPKVL